MVMANITNESAELEGLEALLAKAEQMEAPACGVDNPEECEACGA